MRLFYMNNSFMFSYFMLHFDFDLPTQVPAVGDPGYFKQCVVLSGLVVLVTVNRINSVTAAHIMR